MGWAVHNYTGSAMRNYVQRRPRKPKPSPPVVSFEPAMSTPGFFLFQEYLRPDNTEGATYHRLNDYMRMEWYDAWVNAGRPSRFSVRIVPAQMTTGPSIINLSFVEVQERLMAGQRLVFLSTEM